MAKQIITKLLDDLDGGEADETLAFALDGMGYEIDLSSKNAKKVRDFLETFIEASTRTGRVGPGAQLQRARPTVTPAHHMSALQNRERNQLIREWAIQNGYDVAERGRIPQSLVDAYDTKTPNPARTTAVQQELLEPEKKPPAKKVNGSKVVNFKPERARAAS